MREIQILTGKGASSKSWRSLVVSQTMAYMEPPLLRQISRSDLKPSDPGPLLCPPALSEFVLQARETTVNDFAEHRQAKVLASVARSCCVSLRHTRRDPSPIHAETPIPELSLSDIVLVQFRLLPKRQP